MAAKSKREIIKLASEGKTAKGKATGTFYSKTLNKSNQAEKGEKKFSIKKFDKRAYNPETGRAGMHVEFKQAKIK